jgi:hypothetical protein
MTIGTGAGGGGGGVEQAASAAKAPTITTELVGFMVGISAKLGRDTCDKSVVAVRPPTKLGRQEPQDLASETTQFRRRTSRPLNITRSENLRPAHRFGKSSGKIGRRTFLKVSCE